MKDFKPTFSPPKATANPVLHFATLTKRELPDVMPHQKSILETYAQEYQELPDVALQLPTGSGKTLVGLLIADWRRLKHNEKVVYLCPTRQLVKQTVQHAHEKYGIDVVDLSGSKDNFAPNDKTDYLIARKVAVSTYNGLFNTHPFFNDPNVIIVDDVHAAENYIAGMWTLRIETETTLHNNVTEFLQSYISSRNYDRLRGNWFDSSDANWVEKIPSPELTKIEASLRDIVDGHLRNAVDGKNKELYFKWSMIRDHLHACQMYLASREILIRPLIPPSFVHSPFVNAKQRIFMSATPGAGGDLERLTGRKKITRLPAPSGFETVGVGRRFFVLPILSLSQEETHQLRTRMQKFAGRSVVLTPSNARAEENKEIMRQSLPSWQIFGNAEIEKDKTAFVNTKNSVAVLANRYDGIDFPKDQCRLLCIDGLPLATNAQEMFILSKMGSRVLYDERIQTRVFQATGRCTRALEDRSAVMVTDSQLTDYLINIDRRKHFSSTLQAELNFGETQSTGVESEDIFDCFQMFMDNKEKWAGADNMIREGIANFEQIIPAYAEELSQAVAFEVEYQEAIWNQDFEKAIIAVQRVISQLVQPELRGYRALWHYLAGSVYLRLTEQANDRFRNLAIKHFKEAKKAAPNVIWLHNFIRNTFTDSIDLQDDGFDDEIASQVAALESNFLNMGVVTNHKFEKISSDILRKLDNNKMFETAHKELGNLLGFSACNGKGDATPDCWWLGAKVGLVFEDHAGGKSTTSLGAHKALQAANHSKWLKENVAATKEMEIKPIIITPSTKVGKGAVPQLEGVRYWRLDQFTDWATKAIASVREIKGTFHQEGDLAWRAEASKLLESHNLTLKQIIESLPQAKDELTPQ